MSERPVDVTHDFQWGEHDLCGTCGAYWECEHRTNPAWVRAIDQAVAEDIGDGIPKLTDIVEALRIQAEYDMPELPFRGTIGTPITEENIRKAKELLEEEYRGRPI